MKIKFYQTFVLPAVLILTLSSLTAKAQNATFDFESASGWGTKIVSDVNNGYTLKVTSAVRNLSKASDIFGSGIDGESLSTGDIDETSVSVSLSDGSTFDLKSFIIMNPTTTPNIVVTSSKGSITFDATQTTINIAGSSDAAFFKGITSFTVKPENNGGGFLMVFDDFELANIAPAAPTITLSPTTLTAATVGTAYSKTITSSGGQSPYSYTISTGSLPAGLTLTSGGLLSGTPTAGGAFNFTVKATDASASPGPYSGTKAYTLTVNAPTITLSPTTLTSGNKSSAYSTTITSSGGTAPYTYAVTSGALPGGITLSTGGVLSGSPTATGSYNFGITATDQSTGSGPYTGSHNYSITVDPALTLTVNSVSLLDATITNSSSVRFQVVFSDQVTGVTASTFTITAPTLTGTSISSVTGTGTTYVVTVATGTGDGSLGLEVNGSGVTEGLGNVPYTIGNSYTIDKTAPVVTLQINNGATATNNTAVNLSETATDADATLQMRFSPDGSGWGTYEAFATTKSYTLSFADEDKTLGIQVMDQAGNVGTAYAYITLDKTAPTTTITANPAATTNSSSAAFEFASDETGSAFEASLDGGPYGSVTSPKTYTGLSEGSHTFAVRATDAAGNTDATAESYTWIVDTTPPMAVISSTAGVSGSTTTTSPIPVTVTFSEAVTGFASSSIILTNGSIDNFAGSGTTYTFDVTPSAQGNITVDVPECCTVDAAGNDNLAATQYTITYTLPAPTITSVTVPANGTYKGAETLSFTVNTSQSVTVTGTPKMALTIGSSTVYATFASGSGTSALVFTYTVQAGDLDNNGITIGVLSLNGGNIQNSGSTDMVLTLNNAGSTASVNVDAVAPDAPSTPAMTAGTDSGISNSDAITSNTTPVFKGTAEANATVKLYDTNGTTVLGTTTADGSGNWSITSSTLSQGSHTITAKATDGVGNTGTASAGVTVTIDTQAPTTLALSATSVNTVNAANGSTIATLSATDATAIQYGFAVGNGTNDADNSKFNITGTSLVTSQDLTAGTYHIYLSATDAAGNIANQAFSITVIDGPSINSVLRASGASANVLAATTSVNYTVTFSQAVTGVDKTDFTLTNTSTAGGTIISLTGSGDTYTVTVNTLSGDGTLRLDLNDSGTGIQNGSSAAITGGYHSGETYTLDHTAPSLSAVAIISDNSNTAKAKTGNKVTLTFTAAETIPTTTVTIAGHTATATNTSGNTWAATYTLVSGDTEGTVPFTINFADAVGNAATAVTATTNSSAVTFDKTAPTANSLIYASNNSNSAVAKVGDAINLTFVTDEAIQASTVTIGGHTVTATNSSGNTWKASYTETSGDVDGRVNFAVSFTDLAGNVSTTYNDIDAGDEINFDNTVPTLSSVSIASNNTNTSAAKTGDVVTLSFTGSEDIATPTVTIAGVAATVSGAGTTWTATHTISGAETEGIVAFNISFSDIAGNSGTDVSDVTDGSSVTYDKTPPTVSIGSPSASPTTAGPVTYTVTYNDGTVTLANADVTLNKTGTANATVAISGTGLTRTVKLSSITGDGSIGISLAAGTAKDGAGNPVAAAGPSSTFKVYNTAPTNIALSNASVNENQPSGTTVGSFSSTGTNNSNGDTYTYFLISGTGSTNNSEFTIDVSGNLLTAASFDYESVPSHTYTIRVKTTDAVGLSFEKAFTIAIDNLNDAPVVVNDTYAAIKNVELTVSSSNGVLNNDTDADGDALTATLVSGPTNGSLTLNVNGSFTYTPTTDYTGSDSFTYKVNDGTANGNTATATINIGNPVITLDAGSLSAMSTTYGTASASQNFTVSGSSLTTGILVTPPAGYEVSTDNSSFASTVALSPTSNVVTSKTVYIRLKATAAADTYVADNVVLSSTDATSVNVPTAAGTISPFAVTITADNATKTYGETLSDETGSVKFTVSATLPNSESVSAVDITYGTGATATDAVATYTAKITPSGASGTFTTGNYDITYAKGDIVVGKRTLTVSATGTNKTYDGSDNATVILSDDRVNSDVFTTNYAATFNNKNVGDNKAVSVTGISISDGASGNYTLAGSTATTSANITARAINVTAQTDTKTYDGTVTSAVAPVVDALQTGDVVGTTPTQQFDNKNAATGKTLSASGLVINDGNSGSNYAVTYVDDNTGVIGAATIIVTADAQSKTYGENDPALTYQITSGALVNSDSFSGALTRDAGDVVGSYPITQGTLALSSNYDLTYTSANLSIGKKSIAITADAKSKIYGETDPALTYQVASGALVNSDAFSGALSRDAGEVVGSYPIAQGTLALSSNYDLTYTGANLAIGKKSIAITADAKNKIYGETDPALTYQVTSGALVNSDAFSGALTRDAGDAVGSYPITQGTLALSSNYALTYTGANFTIGKKTIAITADAKSKVYGDTDPVLTYQVTAGALVNSDTFSGALTRDAGDAAGSYPITKGTLALSSNYDLTYTGANFTIGKKSITITADAKSKVYGETDPALTYQVTSGALINGDAFTGSLTRTLGEAVGTYAITQGTLALSSNYTVTYTGADLTIGTMAITIAADAKSKVFGVADPALTYQVITGELITGDTFTGSLTRDAGEHVGNYAIKQGTLSLNSNYALSFNGATFTITAQATAMLSNLALSQGAALTPVFASSTHNYTSTVPNTVTALTLTPTVADANATITVNGARVISGTASADLPLVVGTNLITVKVTAQDGTTTAIYKVTVTRAASDVATLSSVTASNGVTLTASPGNLTEYTAEVGYDVTTLSLIPTATDPAATIKLNGNTVASGSSSPVALNIGSNKFIIVVTAQNGTKTQYTVTIIRDKGDQTITFAALPQKTYGDADFVLNATSTNSTLPIIYSSDNTTVATILNGNKVHILNAGTANITAKQAASGSFTASSATRMLTVNKAAVEVMAEAQSKDLGSADPVLTYTITGGKLFNGDSFTGKLTRDKGEAAGSYMIKQGTLALSSNYLLTYIGAKLVISAGTLTITANDQSKIYGQANPKFTLSYSGFAKGDDETKLTKQPVIATTATTASGAGTYAVNVSGATLPGYIVKYVKGTLTVNKADLTVTADNKSRIYGAANPVLTVSYDGFVNGDTETSLTTRATASTTATTASLPGTYPIAVDGAEAANYNFTYLTGTLTITPLANAALKNITISAGTLSPAFAADVYSYTTSVGYDVGAVSLTPTYDGPVTVTVNGRATGNGVASGLIALNEGNNTISVIATAQDGITSKTYTFAIYRAVAPANIVANNVLSPNGDGKNDGWVIKDIQLYPNNTVTVYDRAGRAVYSKKGYNNDWNGTLRGAPLAEGTYYYVIELSPQLQKIKGYITILGSR